MVHLRGITWNHPRGLAPLQATAAEFQRLNPGVSITWDVRTLKEFGDFPLEPLCQKYDLIILDHPFIGTGAGKRLVLPLDEWLPAAFLADQAQNTVGPSNRSYIWGGRQWALAVDAAAQVSAYRPDLVSRLGVAVPRTWDDVFRLARSLPPGYAVGMPLVPTDAVCSFISLCANLSPDEFWSEGAGIDPAVGTAALAVLERLKPLLHARSLDSNPPTMLDRAAQTDEIVYVPLAFGYSNYSRLGYVPNLLHFTNVPSHGAEPRGALVGGVGLGISAFCVHKEEAVAYAGYVASGEIQSGLYVENGGQPGHRSAWVSATVNARTNGYFHSTLKTLDLGYLRPRHPGFNRWQEAAGGMIAEFLRHGGDRADLMAALNRLYLRVVQEAVR